MREKSLTKENFTRLEDVCKRIISISEENINGDLMFIQLMCLGENIKEFLGNPIVQNSGINKKL